MDAPVKGRGGRDRYPTQRLDPRVRIDLLIEAFPPPPDRPGPLEMRSVDLSAGGLLCLSSTPLPLNALVRCRIHLPSPQGPASTVRTDAIVLRCDREAGKEENGTTYRIAFYFVDMESEQRLALRRLVHRVLEGKPEGKIS